MSREVDPGLAGPGDLQAAAFLARSWGAMFDDPAQCAELARAGLAAATGAADTALAGVALALELTALVRHGPVEGIAERLAEVRRQNLDLGSIRGQWVCDDLQSMLDLQQGRAAQARQRLRETDAVEPTARSLLERRHTLWLLNVLEFHEGDYEAALPLAHRQLALSRAAGSPTLHGMALQALAANHLAVIDHEAGLPMLEQACALMAKSGSLDVRHHSYSNTLVAQYSAGQVAAAAQVLQAWVADCGPPDLSLDTGRHRVGYALGQIACGNLPAAEEALGDAPSPTWLSQQRAAGWYWTRGRLLLAQNRPAEAEALCRGFLSQAPRRPMPLDEVQLHEVLRSAAEARGDWQLALQAAKDLRAVELPLLKVHARVRYRSLQWQLQSHGHATDERVTQQRLSAVERSIAGHEPDWSFEVPAGLQWPPVPQPERPAQPNMAYLGHEIRTPLSGLMGLTELLLLTKLDEQQHRLISLARMTADSLMRLLNDLLDFSKMEAGHFKLQPSTFNLAELLRESTTLVEPLAKHRRLDLKLSIAPELPQELEGDRARLRQVLGNLLHNALKFTEVGHIRVALTCNAAEDPVPLRLEVSDTGLGIAPQMRQRLFSEYAQAGPASEGGTGLGLAICRQIVQAMGGRIGAEDRTGGGTTFWVELALNRSLKQESRAAC